MGLHGSCCKYPPIPWPFVSQFQYIQLRLLLLSYTCSSRSHDHLLSSSSLSFFLDSSRFISIQLSSFPSPLSLSLSRLNGEGGRANSNSNSKKKKKQRKLKMNRGFTGAGGSGPGSMGPPQGLARYGSAPGSLLAGIAESVIRGGGGGDGEMGAGPKSQVQGRPSRFFPGESPCMASPDVTSRTGAAYGSGDVHVAAPPTQGAPLVRHSSSPAGVLSHLIMDVPDHPHLISMTTTRGIGNYSEAAGSDGVHATANRRLRSEWSFSRQDSSSVLSQISEMSIPEIGEISGNSSDEATGNHACAGGQSYISTDLLGASWEDTNTNSIMFSPPPGKRGKESNGDVVNVTSLSNFDSQFGMPKTSAEFADMERYLQMHRDSIACKVRAKRGCATHPRSIAERERRTRISKRLRKLQDLVPNMDKQTSTSDMLDLAVHYIKELQSQVQKLNQEQDNCTCSRKRI